MKKLRLILTGTILFSTVYLAFSQETYLDKPLVRKAAYFDKTPPLRDMPVILPGERDQSWRDHMIENKSLEDEYKNRRADIPDDFVDPVLQRTYPTGRNICGPILSMDGTGNISGVYPPDTDGDVGLDYYFQMINLSFAIWSKDGTLLYGPVDNSTLWNGFIGSWTGTNDGDPIVMYDEQADRWVASQLAVNTPDNTYWQLVAVSATSDPLGEYYRYAFQMPAFNDYPKLSVWIDGYYASFNMFGSYTRVGVASFQRDSMLVGGSANMVYFDRPGGTFSMLPSDFDGTPPPDGTPCYYGHLWTFDSQHFEIYEFHVDWDNTSNSSFTLVNDLVPASFNPNVPNITQPGTSTHLDALNSMLMFRLQYRNFGDYQTLVTNHTVNASGRAGIRWYEFMKEDTDWYIYQQGTYSPDNNHRWMGSIAMGANGKLALGFSVSSSTVYPSIYYVGQTAGAPLGEMNLPEILITPGTSSQSGINRWGDYSCMSVDPENDTTFWFTTEYEKSNWKTRIISFDFGPLLPAFIDAGNDTLICETEPFKADAQAQYVQTVQWSSSGDGFFVDPSKVDAIYLRGTGDLNAGEVMLHVDVTGFEDSESSDSLLLSFSKLAIANAGADTTICIGETLMLSGSAQFEDSVMWSSDGDGTFDDPYVFNPVYTPGTEDIAQGYVWLKLTAYDSLPCDGSHTDKMKLTLDECTGVPEFAKNDMNLEVIPNPTTGRVKMILTGVDKEPEVKIMLTNEQGQVLFTFKLAKPGPSYSNELDLSYFPKGIYYLKVTTDRNQKVSKVILK